ncbi:MFS transporter [Maribius pontilimi]|uniref:MFS transporter n=1 Tax=Palleronia pontilimi TaxID=1964209 RepID=A0A934IBS1_9RHOB|nr:MFS transporter [Palleronia pontilimi]MBJ3762741.1 MFS transporter [Palleronia pontilimi]
MSDTTSYEETLFEALTEDTDSPGGLSDTAQSHEAGNFLRHAASLSMTKLADGLLSPKLVLSWLLSTLGASNFLVGLLVPIREAGALLPQLFTAPRIHAMGRRKWAWAGGSVVQGLACAGIVVAGLTMEGNAAGIAICVALTVLALARSVCSVSYKDILGKTVGKTRRGSATGLAASVASIGVIVFALMLVLDLGARMTLVIGALTLAAALWLIAGALFATLREEPTPRAAEGTPWGQLTLLREDRQLVLFIVTRGLLTATALAPPYLVLLGAQAGQGSFDQLGALVLASSVASFLSSYVWGRMADRSSRDVLRRSGGLGAIALAGAILLDMQGLAGAWWAMPVVLFVLMIAYHGVRQGRSTYLVDMAPKDQRPAYTAVSNTVIGVVLMGSGLFGALASIWGAGSTLALFAVMCLLAVVVAGKLEDVE